MGGETNILMVYYNPTPEDKEQIAQIKSAFRWLFLAFFFIGVAIAAQLVAIYRVLVGRGGLKEPIVVCLGTWAIAHYCKWCSTDSKPDSWK